MNIAVPAARNGIDVNRLMDTMAGIATDPAAGKVEYRVRSSWQGQTRSQHRIDSCQLGGNTVSRRFAITCDQPFELCGRNTAANPQELLLSALNACMMVGYVVGCTRRGIKLEVLEIETSGELDLRGFLGTDDHVKPGFESLRLEVRIKGNGTPEQFRELHACVLRTSPNYFNVTQPIDVNASLSIG